jgi:hypothetical protein
MNETNFSTRGQLFRNTVIFQLKLMADGFRDLLLLPVSLIASLIGLLRGGDEPDREFNEVLELGRRTERWIDLFGNHAAPETTHAAASMDTLFAKVEETLKQQVKNSAISDRARVEIEQALQLLQDKAARHEGGKSPEQDGQDQPG